MNKPVAYVNNMCNDSIDWKVDPMDLEEGTPLYAKPPEFVQAYVNKEDGLVCAKCFKPFESANNDPVAWMHKFLCDFSPKQSENFNIPLYTHPVKELTDEEIIDLINKHIDYVPDEDSGMKLVGVMDFAKAILRKAQEK